MLVCVSGFTNPCALSTASWSRRRPCRVRVFHDDYGIGLVFRVFCIIRETVVHIWGNQQICPCGILTMFSSRDCLLVTGIRLGACLRSRVSCLSLCPLLCCLLCCWVLVHLRCVVSAADRVSVAFFYPRRSFSGCCVEACASLHNACCSAPVRLAPSI